MRRWPRVAPPAADLDDRAAEHSAELPDVHADAESHREVGLVQRDDAGPSGCENLADEHEAASEVTAVGDDEDGVRLVPAGAAVLDVATTDAALRLFEIKRVGAGQIGQLMR